jgi:hypothetical protein
MIWDEPPQKFFPYSRRKRDMIGDNVNSEPNPKLAGELEYQQHNGLVWANAEFPLPATGKCFCCSTLGATGFLNLRVYWDVLECPLDSELSGYNDCSVQGPATLAPGAGTRVPVTTTSTKTTSSTPTATSDVFSPAELKYSCTGSLWMCGHFTGNFRSFCDVAKSYLQGNNIYGTTSKDSNTGLCYTDGRHARGGCGIFVQGDSCRLCGMVMQV